MMTWPLVADAAHDFHSRLFAGLLLECPGTTAMTLRSTLQLIKSPVQTLSLYDFDRTATSLDSSLFSAGMFIRNLQFSNTQLSMLKDNSLQYLRLTLESLSITHSKLTQVCTQWHAMAIICTRKKSSETCTHTQTHPFYVLFLLHIPSPPSALRLID